MELLFTTNISRPVEQVFDYLSQPENWPHFETDFVEIKQVNDAARHVGAKYSFRRKMPGQIVNAHFQITEYIPGSGHTCGARRA